MKNQTITAIEAAEGNGSSLLHVPDKSSSSTSAAEAPRSGRDYGASPSEKVKQAGGSLSASPEDGPPLPPRSLMAFPPLARLVNLLLTSFNQLREVTHCCRNHPIFCLHTIGVFVGTVYMCMFICIDIHPFCLCFFSIAHVCRVRDVVGFYTARQGFALYSAVLYVVSKCNIYLSSKLPPLSRSHVEQRGFRLAFFFRGLSHEPSVIEDVDFSLTILLGALARARRISCP